MLNKRNKQENQTSSTTVSINIFLVGILDLDDDFEVAALIYHQSSKPSKSSNSFCLLANSCFMASVSRLSLSFFAALSSCDAGLTLSPPGEVPPVRRGMLDNDGSIFESSALVGFNMDEIAFGRCGIGFAGTDDASSSSRVALRLRFLGDGAPCCVVEGVGGPPGWDIVDALL